MKGLTGYLAYRAASAVVGVLPEALMRRAGEGAGWVASFLAPSKLDLVQRNLARVVGGEAATSARARRMFKSYGRYWAEVFWVRPRRVPAILAHSVVEGEEHIIAARDAGRGVIVALPHLGNWEAAGPQARRLGVPMLAAAEALPNRRIVEWFVENSRPSRHRCRHRRSRSARHAEADREAAGWWGHRSRLRSRSGGARR